MEQLKKQRVCVIGSGMAGLVAAYTLQKDTVSRFDVEVIEAVCMSSLEKLGIFPDTTQHHSLASLATRILNQRVTNELKLARCHALTY